MSAPNLTPKRREVCPWCGAEDSDCGKPFPCEVALQAENNAELNRELSDDHRAAQEADNAA